MFNSISLSFEVGDNRVKFVRALKVYLDDNKAVLDKKVDSLTKKCQ